MNIFDIVLNGYRQKMKGKKLNKPIPSFEEGRRLLLKSAEKNFVDGYVNMNIAGGVDSDKRQQLEEIGKRLFEATSGLVKAHKALKKLNETQ